MQDEPRVQTTARNDVTPADKAEAAWGFGCFHFGLRHKPPPNWTRADYINEVTRTLRGIGSVDAAEFDLDAELRGERVDFIGRAPDIGKGDPPYPDLPYGGVKMEALAKVRRAEEQEPADRE